MSITIRRQPLYFGTGSDPLFGWLHTPSSLRSDSTAVVICPPLGHEYINSHRSVRFLADRLASAGIPALRFDYSGTGDSWGQDSDPDRMHQWLASIQEARRVVCGQTGCQTAGLIGIRMGGSLAALFAQETTLPFLVIWGACPRGRAYIRELRAINLTSDLPVQANAGNETLEAGGFVYTSQTAADLSKLDLAVLRPRAQRILLADRDDLPPSNGLAETWRSVGLTLDQAVLPGFAAMLYSAHATVVPETAIDRIVRWLGVQPEHDASGNISQPPAVAMVPSPQAVSVHAATGLRESAMLFGNDGRRFGILTEPMSGSPSNRPWIVMSNAGAVHHVGPNRLYVQLARALGQAGYTVLRMDLPGLGDSIPDHPQQDNLVYQSQMVEEIGTAVAALEPKHQPGNYLLMGLCSGAYSAFHSAIDLRDHRIVESVLINPLSFYWSYGMSLDESPVEHFSRWNNYQQSLRDPKRWWRLLTGQTDVRPILTAILDRLGMRLRMLFQSGKPAPNEGVSPLLPSAPAAVSESPDIDDFRQRYSDRLSPDIRRILNSGRRLTFLFSRNDPGYALLTMFAGSQVKRLVRRGRIDLRFIEHANHTFTSAAKRQELIRNITLHLQRRYP